jgi:hypothetical protein
MTMATLAPIPSRRTTATENNQWRVIDRIALRRSSKYHSIMFTREVSEHAFADARAACGISFEEIIERQLMDSGEFVRISARTPDYAAWNGPND